MQIDGEQVRQIARLARIDLDESAVEGLRDDLRRILDYIEVLDVIDTEGVPATSRTFEETSHLREDRARVSPFAGRADDDAPEAEDGFFRVPRVLK